MKSWLLKKHQAYGGLFLGPDNRRHGNAATVWDDLKKYCQVNKEGLCVGRISGMTDPYASAFLAGKQAVFQRIQKYTYFHFDEESTDGERIRSDSTEP